MAAIVASDVREVTPEQRVIDAALRCIARWGISKTTLDDVAREAHCSRATVYRLFPGGKENLLAAAAAAEVHRFFAGLDERLAGVDDLEELLVAGITYAARFLRAHEPLQFLLAYEPELVLPRISFGHMDDVLRVASAELAPWLAPHVGEEEAPRAAEWVARIVFSYTAAPSERVDVCDEESVRRLVQQFVLPGLVTTPSGQ